jgi:hypothetical protein
MDATSSTQSSSSAAPLDASFSRSGYRAMLDAAVRSGYVFAAFDDYAAQGAPRVCLLRHDVDADLGAALEIARIEAEVGVRSTFFIMLRSPLYNAFGRANQRLAREILDLGHWLGLHYDVAFAPGPQRETEEWMTLEAETLGAMYGAPVPAVSFHQPMLAEQTVPGDLAPLGLVSAFDYPGFTYVSDANKALKMGAFVELFESASIARLQLCIHPIWWATDDPNAEPMDLWDAAIAANLARSQEQVTSTERAFGPPRTITLTRSDALDRGD